MNVVHLVSRDDGGAGVAAYRISSSQNLCGINSRLIVQNKQNDLLNVESIEKNKFDKINTKVLYEIDKLPLLKYKNRKNQLFSCGLKGSNVAKNNFLQSSDLINIHWINNGYVAIKEIDRISKLKIPIVWTFHDMWPFTGGCHYSGDCSKYIDGCSKCHILNSHKKNDLSSHIFHLKKKYLTNNNINVVTCSNWLADCARKSMIFGKAKINVIPNCIDISKFKPINKIMAKDILNLQVNKKIILFGAMSSTSDERKGFKYLIESLNALKDSIANLYEEYELLVFGASYCEDIENLPIKTTFLGSLHDDYMLSLAYNAADVFVAPSLEENLANTVMESLACGTPVVAFNIGGMPDMIQHKINGYLASEKSAKDLANGLKWILLDSENYENLKDNARKKVIENYTYKTVGEKYKKLYEKILANNHNKGE